MGSQDRIPDLLEALTTWFGSESRNLPWRSTRDPWTVLVSELMLQQTQVSRVVERLGPFLSEFPSPSAMASAPASAVITAWTGLGYNRRALNLHRAATVMVADHGGEVPRSLEDLLALPGVGPYTARAVRVFAFEQPDAVVDTNIGRVLARWSNRQLKPSEAQRYADSLVPTVDSWTWNQAIMELGALICGKDPACDSCPVRSYCRWFVAGRPVPDPAVGSAAVSKKQSRFDGSDRQGRAALVRALAAGPVGFDQVPALMGWPEDPDRAERVLATLMNDGMVIERAGRYSLPAK